MLDFIKRVTIALSLALFIGVLFWGTNHTVRAADRSFEGSFIWPTIGELTDTYGTRGGKHFGLDIAAPEGTPVVSVQEGIVSKSYYSSSYGNVVFIKHEQSNMETVYAHLFERKVAEGDLVQANQLIGTVGNTGHSRGNHLHFEMHDSEWDLHKSASVDPLVYLGTDEESVYAVLEHMDDHAIEAMSHYIDEDYMNDNLSQTAEQTAALQEDDSDNYEAAIAMVEQTLKALLGTSDEEEKESEEVSNNEVSVEQVEQNLWAYLPEIETEFWLIESDNVEERVDEIVEHIITVQREDTLWGIAQQYQVTVSELMEWNSLQTDVLSLNQELVVYEMIQDGKYHFVERGDTLSKIASEYDLNLEELMELNELSGTIIHPGERLIVNQ
ncbi:peptidoglycan DD-metalloendopeptidase family protein [Alkalihalobacillus pseudalcaliphilus]|uniref:peptidoglycan DD-metalloendopeptidase family protein n=1 Tax=Alkalihalobacillus pseudalcaliphilus TaxID=79884 RepID=UPI00069D3275|nr:peptidoglycan DD-metalloendopeptidase family protein [Alkalihalobacillus pseudalcaliphilus]